MIATMTAKNARDGFTDLLGRVYYSREPIAVEKKGRVFAVVINPDEYEELKRIAKSKFFEIVDQVRKDNPIKNPDEVLQEVTSVVEEVRTENNGRAS